MCTSLKLFYAYVCTPANTLLVLLFFLQQIDIFAFYSFY